MVFIGNELKRLRQYRGLTQSELSKGVCSRQHLAGIEAGSVVPAAHVYVALCSRLECPTGQLLDDYLEAQHDERELSQLAILLSGQGELAEGYRIVNRLVRPAASRADLLYLWAQMLDSAGHWAAALVLYRSSVRSLAGERLVEGLYRAAKCAKRAGNLVESHQLNAEALTHASANRSVSAGLKARITLNLANVEFALGAYSSASVRYNDAHVLARQTRDIELQISALLGVSVCLLELRRFADADKLLTECEVLCSAVDRTSLLPRIYNNQAIVKRHLGLYDEAVRLLNKSIDLDRVLGATANVAYSLNEMTQVHLERGQIAEASRRNEEALGLMHEVSDFRERALAHELAARIALSRGDLDSALRYLDLSIALLGNIPGARMGVLLCQAAEIASRLGRHERTAEYCQAASRLFSEFEKEEARI